MKTKVQFVAVLVLGLCGTTPCFAHYNPSTGRWLSRDPIDEPSFKSFKLGEIVSLTISNPNPLSGGRLPNRDFRTQPGGFNSYGFVGNSALNFYDIFGLKMVMTKIGICDGYIKGDWFWGWKSAHTFISADGLGYGFYAKSHLYGGGSSCSHCGNVGDFFNSLNDEGVVLESDLNTYPNISNPKARQSYSTCLPIWLDDSEYDIRKFEGCVINKARAGIENPERYHLGFNDCRDFALGIINSCREGARLKQRTIGENYNYYFP